jgi:hypothetical protein
MDKYKLVWAAPSQAKLLTRVVVRRGVGMMVVAAMAGCANSPNSPNSPNPPKAHVPTAETKAASTAAATTTAAAVTARPQGYSATVCARGEGGIQLSQTDRFIFLQGGICPGDDKRFKTFLATVPPNIRLIKLASGGGNGGAAQAIGVMLREAGFNTYVDATRDRCASACTHIFAAGVERFYAGSSEIKTGRDARVGLGYHYLNSRRPEQTDDEKDKVFNATAAVYLKKMLAPAGVEAATALMSSNRTTQMTWLNGNEALQAGIATSLSAPPM